MVSLTIATALAAMAALFGNRLLFRLQGRRALVTLIPLWEELCKGVAVWAVPSHPLLLLHVLFGLLEFAYSAWGGERFLGLVGLSIHGLAGGLAAWAAGSAAPSGGAALFAGVLCACLLHVLLNLAVLWWVLPTLGLAASPPQLLVDPRPGGRYNARK